MTAAEKLVDENLYPLGHDVRSKCGKARASFRPDWSQKNPWAVYVNGTATLHCTDLDHVRRYLATKGIKL